MLKLFRIFTSGPKRPGAREEQQVSNQQDEPNSASMTSGPSRDDQSTTTERDKDTLRQSTSTNRGHNETQGENPRLDSNPANELNETRRPRSHPHHRPQQRRKIYPKRNDELNKLSSVDQPIEQIDPKLLSDTELKSIGNKLCSLHRHDEAIVYYSHAVDKSPNVAIYYSNRALCYLKLQQWDKTICDCRKALELDPNLIKTHFFLGQALIETLNYEDALKHLEKAHELAKEKKVNFGDDIAQQIRLVKRLYWTRAEDETSKFEDELHKYISDLIAKDKQKSLKSIEDRRQAIKGAGSSCQPDAPASTTTPCQDVDCEVSNELDVEEQLVVSRCDKYSDKLAIMFNDLKLRRRKREVPEYLCGKISFEIMRDPVITPSGITYDRQDIEEHLKRVGHFDPITRQPLKASQLISNLAMKEVVDAYLNDNEWALYH